MIYTSDIIRKIVTSESCLKALQRISPIYADAENFLYILNAIHAEVDRFKADAEQLKKESMPQTAQELLPLWEAEYGIARDVSLNVDERRARIMAKIGARSSINPYKLQEIIRAETGVSAFVQENTGKNTFTVRMVANNQNDLRHKMEITNIVKRYKPAHLMCDVRYETVVKDRMYVGGVARISKRVALQQK